MSARPLPKRRIIPPALLVLTSACAMSSVAVARTPLSSHAGPYELEVLVDGMPAPTFHQAGDTYLLGSVGSRYTLRISNRSARRIEAVVSIDGRDVIDGRPGDFRSKRGYLVPAWGSVDIDGWRTSQAEVAAFRFSSVARSYAARTGSAREVGVIGVAIFPEQYTPPPPPPQIIRPPYPQWREYDRGEDAEAPRSSAGRAPAPAPAPGAAPSRGLAEGGPADGAGSAAPPQSRPGLGTEFGEAVTSYVQEVPFVRASPLHPSVLLGARYNDRAGLVAMGVDVDGPPWYSDADLRQTAEPFPVSRRYSLPPAGWR